MKVLIVDDNQVDRMLLGKMLSSNNYEVIEAADGAEALKKSELEKPDIIVSDIMMPVMDGFTLLRELRKIASFKDIPFVFYSASYATKKDIEFGQALGVSKFIVKPAEPRELVNEIKNVLIDFSKGKIKSQESSIKEKEYFELYSNRLFKKLEENVRELMQEIQERKQIETALRENEAKFRATFEQAPIGMQRMDLEGRLIETNRVFRNMLGYGENELRNMSFKEFTHVEDVKTDIALFEELILGNRDRYKIKKRYIRKNGTMFWGRVTVSLVRDTSGKPQFAIRMVEDITEQMSAEEELRVKAYLLDNASDFIYVHDLEGNFIYVNEAAYKLRGFTQDEMLRKNLRDILAPEFRPLMEQRIKETLDKGEIIFESHHIINGDTWMPVEVKSSVIEYRGKEVILSVTRDITLRKQAEKMQKEKTKAELYGFIVSALPVFASGVPSYIRDVLIKNFSDRFEKNVKPRFIEEMEQRNSINDKKLLIKAYISWLSELFLNFGIENRKITNGNRETLEFINCPWKNEACGNPIFCFICRSLAKRSFTWTGLHGNVDQRSSIANGSKICKFEIQMI